MTMNGNFTGTQVDYAEARIDAMEKRIERLEEMNGKLYAACKVGLEELGRIARQIHIVNPDVLTRMSDALDKADGKEG
jgi:hypothetical protein